MADLYPSEEEADRLIRSLLHRASVAVAGVASWYMQSVVPDLAAVVESSFESGVSGSPVAWWSAHVKDAVVVMRDECDVDVTTASVFLGAAMHATLAAGGVLEVDAVTLLAMRALAFDAGVQSVSPSPPPSPMP